MRKKFFLLVLVTMLFSLLANAAARIDGIYYFLDSKSKTAMVSSDDSYPPPGTPCYSGDVVIPEEITYKGEKYVVTGIRDYAFYWCKDMTSITLPNTIGVIGDEAFWGCSSLASISIPEKVKSIGNRAFSGCSGLKDFYMYPHELVGLYNNIFWYNDFEVNPYSNATMHVHNDLINEAKIKWPFFKDYKGLDDADDEPAYANSAELNGILYTLNNTDYTAMVDFKGEIKESGMYTVYDCSYSGDIVIPASITVDSIQYTVTRISGIAFSGDNGYSGIEDRTGSDITSIVIPNTIKIIEAGSFNGCKKLVSVSLPDSLKSIDICAFKGCKSLKSINIPDNVSFIGYWAFMDCSSLVSAVIPNSVTSMGFGVFEGCSSMTDLYLYYDKIDDVPAEIVYGLDPNVCIHVHDVLINDYKRIFGNFKNFKGLDNMDFKLTYYIDNEEYKSVNYKYDEDIIPEEAPIRDGFVFNGWKNLPKIMPANDLSVYGDYRIGRYKLTYIVDGVEYKSYDVDINTSVTPEPYPVRKGMTFYGWNNVPQVMPERDVDVYGTFAWSKSTIDNVTYQVSDTINNYATVIQDNKSCTEAIIASSVDFDYSYTVTTIANKAFYGKKNIVLVEIPATITEIGARAFANIDKLNDVYCYAEEVPNTDRTAFENSYIEDYVTLHVPSGSISKYKETAPWKNFKEIVAIPGTEKAYTLTYTVDGETYKTVEVKEGETITPEAEPTKEGYTFTGWDDLPDTMPGHDVTVSGSYTINKYKLIYMVDGEVYMTIEVEYGATITPEDEPTKDGYVFSGWSWIPSKMPAEDVTVSGTFKQIGYNVSDNIYIIDGNEATFAMTNVTSGDLIISPTIIVNNITYNVTSVAGYSCMNNTGITSVTIPDGVAIIGDNAFYGCTGVKSLSLGKDIGYIGNMAFAYIGTSASARKRASSEPLVIECHAESVPDVQNDSFEGIDMENAILKVNDDLVDAYKNLYPWSQFTNIVGFNAPTDINSIYSEDNGSSIFSIDGRKIDNPKKGMNIIRTSQGTRKVMVK